MALLDGLLRQIFYRFGLIVYRLRLLCLLVPILLTVTLSYGISYIDEREVNDTEYVFTPIDSRANADRAMMAKLWPLRQDRFMPGKSFEMR